MKSNRKFGVEIETSSSPDAAATATRGGWSDKSDCSIDGREFVSPILQGDDGIESVRNMVALMNDRGYEVNYRCGLHVHYDMPGLTMQKRKLIAYAYRLSQDEWFERVGRDRQANCYCPKSRLPAEESLAIGHITHDRAWINFYALEKHGTIEVRLLESTLDAGRIVTWIEAHMDFMEWAMEATQEEIEAGAAARVLTYDLPVICPNVVPA